MECRYCLKPRVLFSPTSPSRMNPSAEGASASSAEVIGECRAYASQQLEVTEQSELYTCSNQHVNQVIMFMACLSLANCSCVQTQWKFSTTPTVSRRHHGIIRSFILIVHESMTKDMLISWLIMLTERGVEVVVARMYYVLQGWRCPSLLIINITLMDCTINGVVSY